MRKPSIFISYSQENQLIAGKVNSYLQKCGLRTWFDKENIRPGENIEYEIKKGIKEASIFLIIISNNNSKFLDFEYMLIKKENETKDKKIIPVYTKETKPDSIFSAYQGVFLENDSIKEIDKIYTAIRNNQSIWAKLKEYIEN